MTRPDLSQRHGLTDAPQVAKSYKSPLFWTVTGLDFGRAIRWSKARGNEAAAKIREMVKSK